MDSTRPLSPSLSVLSNGHELQRVVFPTVGGGHVDSHGSAKPFPHLLQGRFDIMDGPAIDALSVGLADAFA